jgi:hypothetical protein
MSLHEPKKIKCKVSNATPEQAIRMPDLILSITPEHDVRCFLPPDQPDALRGCFRIFDFLPVIARPPNEYRKDGGGFANNY